MVLPRASACIVHLGTTVFGVTPGGLKYRAVVDGATQGVSMCRPSDMTRGRQIWIILDSPEYSYIMRSLRGE